MSNDEHACILKLCHQNLETNVRKCIMQTFNNYMDAYCDQLSELKKKDKIKKVMKRFQQKLKFIALNEDCDDLQDDFFDLLCTEIDYLETILMQITKLKLQLLSKVRTAKMKDVDMKLPDKSEFARDILQKNAYTFFHLVPMYYNFYQTRNMLQIKPIIDSVTQEVMDTLTTRTYSVFFSRPPEPHVVYQNKIGDIMKKSGCSDTNRPIPKEVEDAFGEDEDEKDDQPKAPEYKTVYMDDEHEKDEKYHEEHEKNEKYHEKDENEDEIVSESNKEEINLKSKEKENREDKLNELLKKIKDDDSNASDDLEDSLPVNMKE